MNTHTEAHPLEVAAALVLSAAEALAPLLLLLVALVLALSGWRPVASPAAVIAAPRPAEPASPDRVMAPPPMAASTAPVLQQQAPARAAARPYLPPVLEPLEALPVRELRTLARAANLPRCLSSRGRRADLLPALMGAVMAAV